MENNSNLLDLKKVDQEENQKTHIQSPINTCSPTTPKIGILKKLSSQRSMSPHSPKSQKKIIKNKFNLLNL